MMAMTGTPDAVSFGHRHGCNGGGCTGCYGGSCYGGCYGGGCMGCYGGGCSGGYSGCNGCSGGCHGGRGGLFHKHRGSGCCGCSGGGGCYGGCYGGGCMGCYGGGMGCYGGCMGCYGGGYGGYGGYMMGVQPMGPTGAVPATGPNPNPGAAPANPPVPNPGTRPGGTGMIAAPATIVVNLPADAVLKVDGARTRSTTALRTFATPVLPFGQDYHYTLTAEVVRDGKTLTATEQVTVRAGQTSQVQLPTTAFGTTLALAK
jgi:uncharacterized protein (TIGR03000 family)